ncbi:TPA: hypothetical protein ROR13_002187 [Escherichia coli]|uniref:hypothetical protein n=1 Tax=Escherichia coli TaxID=562 RepID=UPI000D0ACA2F|nr:hypothetical protein [Escherichia coli]EFD6890635.1 hypothetical protein [Escherichia coli]EIV7582356.1 hypothetical protein [Escherichia coli]EJC7892993.1 hypothetical protein [Escherichia coli]MCL7071441.1 hypothetical protein [Escherichia coli]MCL7245198.1 hypothetical protein [Escherichia coli]
METIIPLVIVFALLWQAVSYARVVFLRRHLMMPQVERYLARKDASLLQKKLATDAFHDALSFTLPVKILMAHRVQEKNKANKVENSNQKKFMAHCMEKSPANEALGEIIHTMFSLNYKFNAPLHLVCYLFRLDISKVAESRTVRDEVGSVYADLKHQHQHV